VDELMKMSNATLGELPAGIREDDTEIASNDPFREERQSAARAARDHPQVWLGQRHIYGDLLEAQRFAEAFTRWLEVIWSKGCEAALRSYTKQE
jgi:mannitol 2-dehydrogenase